MVCRPPAFWWENLAVQIPGRCRKVPVRFHAALCGIPCCRPLAPAMGLTTRALNAANGPNPTKRVEFACLVDRSENSGLYQLGGPWRSIRKHWPGCLRVLGDRSCPFPAQPRFRLRDVTRAGENSSDRAARGRRQGWRRNRRVIPPSSKLEHFSAAGGVSGPRRGGSRAAC